jgi:hypothetical protein
LVVPPTNQSTKGGLLVSQICAGGVCQSISLACSAQKARGPR